MDQARKQEFLRRCANEQYLLPPRLESDTVRINALDEESADLLVEYLEELLGGKLP